MFNPLSDFRTSLRLVFFSAVAVVSVISISIIPGLTGAAKNMAILNSAGNKTQTIPDKRKLTEAQKKIDSQLLYALARERGAKTNSKSALVGELLVRFDEKGRAIVGIRARVTRKVLDKIESLGGEVIFTSERYNDILAHLPLEKLEKLAALQDVRAIMPAQEATTNSQ